MPVQLLPASAAAFAPRASSVNVVLSSKVEPWLTQTLKRINRVKRPLNSVPQHQRCLTETLSASTAIWSLTSLMLPKPASDRREDENPLVEAMFNYQLVHVEAYVVHVDMVLRNEVGFKLNQDTIDALVDYHKEVHSVDAAAANEHDWPEKETQVKKAHAEFVQAINKYVYRTHVSALEGLEEDGLGELLCGRSNEVKNGIMGLFLPLLPPPPKVVDVVRPPTLLPSSPASHWWAQPTVPSASVSPVDPWRVLPSSPNTTTASTSPDVQHLWAGMSFSEVQVPSPQPAFSQPYSSAGMYLSAPTVSAPLPALPLPSMLTHGQCGVSVGFGTFGGIGWDRFQENYAATM